MKRILALLAAAAVSAPLAAFAQDARMSDARYIAASQCLAYADVPELQADGDFTALRQAVRVGYRNSDVAAEARESARRTRITARSLAANESGLEELRERRDAACASFVQTGLVQLGAPTPQS